MSLFFDGLSSIKASNQQFLLQVLLAEPVPCH